MVIIYNINTTCINVFYSIKLYNCYNIVIVNMIVKTICIYLTINSIIIGL